MVKSEFSFSFCKFHFSSWRWNFFTCQFKYINRAKKNICCCCCYKFVIRLKSNARYMQTTSCQMCLSPELLYFQMKCITGYYCIHVSWKYLKKRNLIQFVFFTFNFLLNRISLYVFLSLNYFFFCRTWKTRFSLPTFGWNM